jgi:hypothetical protein
MAKNGILLEEARQRLIFMGVELKDDKTVGQVGVEDESRVLQVFLRPASSK